MGQFALCKTEPLHERKGTSMNEQQAKRGPGRPRKGGKRQHIDLTLSAEIIDWLGAKKSADPMFNKSAYIEVAIKEKRQRESEN